MNVPYGYGGNMGPRNQMFNNRPRFNPSPAAPRPTGQRSITLAEVSSWLERQQPFVLQSVMKTCKNLLTNKHSVPVEDLSEMYEEGAAGNATKTGTILQGGVDPDKTAVALKRDLNPGIGWTKSDMRHPHKVTHQMKPLPELEIIPPFSVENKEADIDRDKRKMLTNNVNMMQIEVNKICHRFKIPPAQLDKDNLEQYPDNARDKLKIALTCVKNAERTLTDFLDFLKNEKYKCWNEEQHAKREELLRSMIGDVPKGKPHASGIREEDIELVDAQFDKDGKISKLSAEEKSQDELEEAIAAAYECRDGEPPTKKTATE